MHRLKLLEKKLLPTASSVIGVVSPVAVALPLVIPEIARGYEAIYERFINGKLIYKPNKENDVGRVELPISDFLARGQNPLESTFDLSSCGDARQDLSISTGYRRVVKSEFGKWEVFITPKFLIEINRGSSASHYTEILGEQVSPFAFMQNSSEWDDLNKYWYHVTLSDEDLNTQNLYQIACQSTTHNASTFSSFIPHYFNSYMVHCAIPQMSQFFFNFN